MSRTLNHFVMGLVPVADALAGDTATDVVNMKNYGRAQFLLIKGAGATGTTQVTVEACDDAAASNQTAIPFSYQVVEDTSTTDVPAAIAKAEAAGFETTAGANQIYRIDVDASDMAATGYGFLRLALSEQTDDPCTACVLVELSESKESKEQPATAIA